MNTLAVTFLLEVDDMMYIAVLSDEQKSQYQSCGEDIHSSSECAGRYELCTYTWHTRALKVADCILMVVIFVYFRYDPQFGRAFVLEQSQFTYSWRMLITFRWFLPYAVRAVVHCMSCWTWQEAHGHIPRMSHAMVGFWCTVVAVSAGVGGIAYYSIWKTLLGSSNFNLDRLTYCLGTAEDPTGMDL